MENKDKPAYPVNEKVCGKEHELWLIESGRGLTKREAFCLHNGVPDTGDPVLDEIIKKANHRKVAMAAMEGILSNPANNNLDLMGVNTAGPLGFIAANFAAKEAVQYADALLKELDK